MPKYLVSVPFSLHVTVEANSTNEITEEMVDQALINTYGKYAEIDLRHGGGFFDILEELKQ